MGECLRKAQRCQKLCHDSGDVRCAFWVATEDQKVEESLGPDAPGVQSQGAETSKDRSARQVLMLSQLGRVVEQDVSRALSFTSWADADLVGLFRGLERVDLFRKEAQSSGFERDLRHRLDEMAVAADLWEKKLDVAKAIDEVLETVQSLEAPESGRGLSDLGAVLDVALAQKWDLKVAAHYTRWSAHLCAGLTNFTFQPGNDIPALMFAIAAGHLENHLQDCKLQQIQAAKGLVQKSLGKWQGLRKIRKVLDATVSWGAWLTREESGGGSSNALKGAVQIYVADGLKRHKVQGDRATSFESLDDIRTAFCCGAEFDSARFRACIVCFSAGGLN